MLTRVSLIIPTYNREAVLVETLESVLKIDYPKADWEIIVVDQTREHQPATVTFLSDLEAAGKIRWFKPPQIDFASLTKARNFGLRQADNPDLILFVDDDVEVRPDFIQQHLSGYLDEQVGATVGKVEVLGQGELPLDPRIGGINWWGRFFTNYHGDVAAESGNFIGCNFSLRASLLPQLGYFDEEFIGNAMREESDMAVRVREIGLKIRFVPGAFVLHKMQQTGGTRSEQRIRWYYSLFYNNFLFYGKHAALWRVPFFILQMWRPILACWLFYGKGSPKAAIQPWLGICGGLRAAARSKKLGAALPRQAKRINVF